MGVPALFRWLSQKYPKIVSSVIEEHPQEIDGQTIPVDITKPNPNGEELDNLYLDMNGIVHPCSHPEDRPPPETEEEMMLEVFKYTDRVINMVRPRKVLMIAIDGVAPRAKMNQQRSRRFRSAQEAKEKDEEAAKFIKLLQAGGKTVDDSILKKKAWDSNAITPGTPFMDILAASLRYWVAYKLNTDPGWAKLKVIISDSTVPGEGEHKIMEFVRSQRASPDHDPNTRHVIYGLDADLIMLGLGTHEPHFRVLREDVFAAERKKSHCKLCGQTGHRAEECSGKAKEKVGEFDEKEKGSSLKPFIWLHVEILREYLAAELDLPGLPFKFDLERAIDDWVFMCFFVGNDFLPHLPSLDIRDGGIDTLNSIWRNNLAVMGGYLTKDGHVNLDRAQIVLKALADQEDAIFRRRKAAEDRRDNNAKRRRQQEQARNFDRNAEAAFVPIPNDLPTQVQTATPPQGGRRGSKQPMQPNPMIPLFRPGDRSEATKAMNHDMIVNRGAIRQANLANKSAAAALKASLLGGGTPASESTEPPATPEKPKAADGEATSPLQPSPHSAIPAKRKADMIEEEASSAPGTPDSSDAEEPNLDTVQLWSPGYQDRYYTQKFKVSADDKAFRKKVADAYVEGLCWVLLYYFQGCPSWTWYYPYHYAPFAQDFQDLGNLKIEFNKGKPFKPFEQLMGVLPAASQHNLPEPFRKLMTDPDSEIIDFYPEDFPIDLNGKKFAWQGVALLPFIDEKRLLDAVEKIYPTLSEEEAARNAMGHDVLFISDKHPLYDDLAGQFFSRRQQVESYSLKPKVSEGLTGIVKKDPDFILHSSFPCPLKEGSMPDLTSNSSMSVRYEIPHSKHTHKSMLLRGVKLNPPVLTYPEIQQIRQGGNNRGGRNGGGGRGPGFGGGGYGGNRGSPHQQTAGFANTNAQNSGPASSRYNYSPSNLSHSSIPPPGYPPLPIPLPGSNWGGSAPAWPPAPGAQGGAWPPPPPPPPIPGMPGVPAMPFGLPFLPPGQGGYPPPPPPPQQHRRDDRRDDRGYGGYGGGGYGGGGRDRYDGRNGYGGGRDDRGGDRYRGYSGR